jgi:hypothetical protein
VANESSSPRLSHLHTYFLFPFVIDKEVVMEEMPAPFKGKREWVEGLTEWVREKGIVRSCPLKDKLGAWRRSAYQSFSADSPAYQDMVLFHPVVRRIYFDTVGATPDLDDAESLLRCFELPIEAEKPVFLEASDEKGRSSRLQVTDLRLFIFTNGIGILSIGLEAFDIPVAEALWVNEMLRKVYPSSGRQRRESRIPAHTRLLMIDGGEEKTLSEERFSSASLVGFHAPLSRIIQDLLYFASYRKRHFEQVLDERMNVYSYACLDKSSLQEGYLQSEAFQVLLSRLPINSFSNLTRC